MLLDVLLYYLAGGVSALFAALCGLYELTRRRQVALGVGCLALAAALPAGVALYSYDLDAADAFVNLHPFRGAWAGMVLGPFEPSMPLRQAFGTLGVLHATLMLFYPAAALVAALARSAPPGRWSFRALGVFLVVGAAFTWATFDVDVKRRIETDYHASRRDWESVLASARGVSAASYDVYVMHEVNRALYHAGRLPTEMCAYPQCNRPPGLRMSDEEATRLGCTKFAEWCFEMGNLNFVRHWASTGLEIEIHSPRLLLLLSKVHALAGRPEAAKAFLNVLSRNLLRRGEALRRLRALEEDPALANDPECRQVRPLLLVRDLPYGGHGGFAYEEMLLAHLDANRRNREAFEYLMAFYLLTRQLDRLCANLGRLDDFDTVGIPRLYEEAVLVEKSLHPSRVIDLHGRRISEETVRRFEAFMSDLERSRNNPLIEPQQAIETLAHTWGDSYFFFARFGHTEPRPGWKMERPAPPTEDAK